MREEGMASDPPESWKGLVTLDPAPDDLWAPPADPLKGIATLDPPPAAPAAPSQNDALQTAMGTLLPEDGGYNYAPTQPPPQSLMPSQQVITQPGTVNASDLATSGRDQYHPHLLDDLQDPDFYAKHYLYDPSQPKEERPSYWGKKYDDMTPVERDEFHRDMLEDLTKRNVISGLDAAKLRIDFKKQDDAYQQQKMLRTLFKPTHTEIGNLQQRIDSLPEGAERGQLELANAVGQESRARRAEPTQNPWQWMNDPRNTQSLLNKWPVARGVVNYRKDREIAAAAERIRTGKYSQDDIANVAFYLNNAYDDQNASIGAQALDIVTSMPAFMAEMYLTEGAFKAGSGLMGKVLGATEEGAIKALGEGAISRLAGNTLKGVAGSVAQTAASPWAVMESTAKRAMPKFTYITDHNGTTVGIDVGEPQDFLKALPAGFLDAAIEIGTEHSGEAATELTKGLADKTLGRLGKKTISSLRTSQNKVLQAIGRQGNNMRRAVMDHWLSKPGRTVPMLQDFIKHGHWNGMVGEWLEERFGDALRLATGLEGLDDNELGLALQGKFKEAGRQFATEALSFPAFDVGIKGLNRVLGGSQLDIEAREANRSRAQSRLDLYMKVTQGQPISRNDLRKAGVQTRNTSAAERIKIARGLFTNEGLELPPEPEAPKTPEAAPEKQLPAPPTAPAAEPEQGPPALPPPPPLEQESPAPEQTPPPAPPAVPGKRPGESDADYILRRLTERQQQAPPVAPQPRTRPPAGFTAILDGNRYTVTEDGVEWERPISTPGQKALDKMLKDEIAADKKNKPAATGKLPGESDADYIMRKLAEKQAKAPEQAPAPAPPTEQPKKGLPKIKIEAKEEPKTEGEKKSIFGDLGKQFLDRKKSLEKKETENVPTNQERQVIPSEGEKAQTQTAPEAKTIRREEGLLKKTYATNPELHKEIDTLRKVKHTMKRVGKKLVRDEAYDLHENVVSALHELADKKPKATASILRRAKELAAPVNEHLAVLRDQFDSVFGKMSNLRGHNAAEHDETKLPNYDEMREQMEEQYPELGAEARKKGIPALLAGGKKQFAEKPLAEFAAQAMGEYFAYVHEKKRKKKRAEKAKNKKGEASEEGLDEADTSFDFGKEEPKKAEKKVSYEAQQQKDWLVNSYQRSPMEFKGDTEKVAAWLEKGFSNKHYQKYLDESGQTLPQAIDAIKEQFRTESAKVKPPKPDAHVVYMTGSDTKQLAESGREDIGLLITPATQNYLKNAHKYSWIAFDNGAFQKAGFNEAQFNAMLEKAAADPGLKGKVLFVVAPDVVGDQEATIAKSLPYLAKIRGMGFPAAIALQNGAEDMRVSDFPWDKIDVLFIGGDTDFKLGQIDDAERDSSDGPPNAAHDIKKFWDEAHRRGIPIHVGRVNSEKRLRYALTVIGATSMDGTYAKFGPAPNSQNIQDWLDRSKPEEKFQLSGEGSKDKSPVTEEFKPERIPEAKRNERQPLLGNMPEDMNKGTLEGQQGLFQEKKEGEEPKGKAYSIDENARPGYGRVEINTAAIEKLIPGATVEQRSKKNWRITLPNGRKVDVLAVRNIMPTAQTLEAVKHRYPGIDDEMWSQYGAAGVYEMLTEDGDRLPLHGLISLSALFGADERTLKHELVHWSKALGMWTDEEWDKLAKRYGRGATAEDVIEERIAIGLEKDMPNWMRKVADFFRKLLKALGIDLPADVRKVMSTPEFWQRTTKVGRSSRDAGYYAKFSPGWYIKSEILIDEKMGERATPQQVLAMLQKNGVKEEELEWMGLKELLGGAGLKTVTKQQVLDVIKNGGLKVVEVLKGAPKEPKRITDLRGRLEELLQINDTGRLTVEQHDEVLKIEEELGPYDDTWASMGPNVETRYDEYTLPGGKDYHELLFVMPRQQYHKDIKLARAKSDAILKEMADKYGADTNYEKWTPGDYKRYIESVNEISRAEDADTEEDTFHSSHWGEQNVLAHMRFKERKDAEGKRVLFLEEIQSDWHQTGRQIGYRQEPTLDEAKRINELGNEVDLLNFKIEQKRRERAAAGPNKGIYRDGVQWAVISGHDENGRNKLERFNTRDEAEAWLHKHEGVDTEKIHRLTKEMDDLSDQRNKLRSEMDTIKAKLSATVPNAPFKKTWPMLAMKRAIQWAAEEGFDKVAWTTGKQQADRYSIRGNGTHGFTSLSWEPSEFNDSTDISAVATNGLTTHWTVDVNGKAIKGPHNFIGRDIGEIVGAHLAERIMSEGKGAATDDELSAGGEGMKGFYDDILPAETNKFIKKWGAKVGMAEIATQDFSRWKYTGPVLTKDEVQKLADKYKDLAEETRGQEGYAYKADYHSLGMLSTYLDRGGEGWQSFFERSAPERAKRVAKLIGGDVKEIPQTNPQHSFDITPAMRESAVAMGQPLFAPPRYIVEAKDKKISVKETKYGGLSRRIKSLKKLVGLATKERGWSNIEQFKASQEKLAGPKGMIYKSRKADAKKAREEFKQLVKDFAEALTKPTLSSTGFDPKLIEIGVKMIVKAVEVGIKNFRAFLDAFRDEFGEEDTISVQQILADAWNIAKEDLYNDLDVAVLDTPTVTPPTVPQDAPKPPKAPGGGSGGGTSEKKPQKPTEPPKEGEPKEPEHPSIDVDVVLGRAGMTVKKATSGKREVWEVSGRGIFTYKRMLDKLGATPAYNKDGTWVRAFYEDPKEKIAEALQSHGPDSRPATDDGGLDRPSPVRTDKQPDGKVLTARWEFTAPEDTSVLAPSVAEHLTEEQKQRAAKAIKSMDDPNRGGFLDASGTGTGKTFSSLAVAKTYADRGHTVFIIAPNEALGKPFEGAGRRKPKITGSWADASRIMNVPLELLKDPIKEGEKGKIYVTSYNRMQRYLSEAVDGNSVLIFDEAHALKNLLAKGTPLAINGDALAQRAKAVLYVTATPVDQPAHVAYLGRTGAWEGRTFDDQAKRLGLAGRDAEVIMRDAKGKPIRGRDGKPLRTHKKIYGVRPGVTIAELAERLNAMFERLTAVGGMIKHELSMKGVSVEIKRMVMPPAARKTATAIAEGMEGVPERLIYMAQRRQEEPYKIATVVEMTKEELNHKDGPRKVILFVSRVNRSEAGRWVEGPMGERVKQIFAASDGTAKLLKEALAKEGIRDVAELHGNAGTKAAESMRKFQGNEARVLIATVESGGTGVNLDDLSGDSPRTMIVVTAPFSAVHAVQAAGRVWRLNTKSIPVVRFLFGDSETESRNSAIIAKKIKMLGATVQGDIRRLDVDEIPADEYEAPDDDTEYKSFLKNEPIEPVQVPGQAFQKPTTKEGTKLLSKLQRDARKKSGYSVGLRSINEYLMDLAQTILFVGKSQTTKRNPAHYLGERKKGRPSGDGPHIVRGRAGYRDYVIHEAGHAISGLLADRAPDWHRDMDVDLIGLTHLPDSQASAHSTEEGWAELVRRYVEVPTTVPKVMREAFEDVMNKHAPEVLAGLKDAQIAYAFQRSRPWTQQRQSLMKDKARTTESGWDTARNMIDRGLFSVFGADAYIARLEKKMWRAIAGNAPWAVQNVRNLFNEESAKMVKLAREFRKKAIDTPADLRSSYQSVLRITQEVNRAVDGAERGREGIRVIVQGDDNLITYLSSQQGRKMRKILRRHGFEIPTVTGKAEHGSSAYFTHESFGSIVRSLGKDWDEFEQYGQDRAALHRFEVARQEYPGIRDGFSPRTQADEIAKAEAAHPDWPEKFDKIQNYFDQLLLVPFMSGEINLKDLIRIKSRWDLYWPLPRTVEDRVPLSGRGGTDPTSALYRAYGSELPFESLKDTARFVTRRAYEAYYVNRQRNAVKAFGKLYAKDKSLPFQARKIAARLMIKLKLDKKVVATLGPEEQQKMIAEAMNLTNARKQGVSVSDLTEDEITLPEDVVLATSFKPIWRPTRPRMKLVVRTYDPAKGAEYWHVPDPLTFEYMTRYGAQANKGMKWLGTLFGDLNRNFQRYITQSLPFAFRNVPRDAATGITLAEGNSGRQLLVGYNHAVGLVSQITGTNQEELEATEMLSRALDPAGTVPGTGLVGDFLHMLKEGIAMDESYYSKPWYDRVAHWPGRVQATLLKPVDILNYATLGRFLSTRSEALGRTGAFINERKMGRSAERAQYKFDTSYGNFAQKSAHPNIAEFIRFAPFLNAGLQIMWGQYQQITDPDPNVRMMFMLARLPQLAVASAVGAALNVLGIMAAFPDPDDHNAIFDDIRETPLDSRLRGPRIGGLVQLSFDYGLTGAIQAPLWVMTENALLKSDMTSKQRKELALRTILRAMDVPGPDRTIPFGPRTWIEVTAGESGYSFFRNQDIVPAWLIEKYPNDPALRTFENVPKAYNKIGQWLGVSPLKVRYVVTNTLASQIDQALVALERPEQTRNELLVVGKLLTRRPSGFYSSSVQSVMDLNEDYKTAVRALKSETDPAKKREIQKQIELLTDAHDAANMIDKLWEAAKAKYHDKKMAEYKAIKQVMVGAGRAGLGLPPLTTFPNPWKDRSKIPAEVRGIVEKRIQYLEKAQDSQNEERAKKARNELKFWRSS